MLLQFILLFVEQHSSVEPWLNTLEINNTYKYNKLWLTEIVNHSYFPQKNEKKEDGSNTSDEFPDIS